MLFRTPCTSSMNFPILYFIPIHIYPSTIPPSFDIRTNTHIKDRGFRTKPISGFSSRFPLQSDLRAYQKYPSSVSASLGSTTHISQNINNGYYHRGETISQLSPRFGSIGLPCCVGGVSSFRAYSSFMGGKGDDSVVANTLNVCNLDGTGSDGTDTLKKVWQFTVDAADAVPPRVQQLLDSHPYLNNVIIPFAWTLTGTLLAWLVMPRVLRSLQNYSYQGRAALLSGHTPQEQVPYEKSFWSSLEAPVRYLITFMAFSQLGVMVAPSTAVSGYITQASKGAVILAVVWFIHRWKTNVFTRVFSTQSMVGLDRERMLTLDKFSSVGLFILGLMALAEAYGVAVQSILTVGGIGGVATAFAARDILMNVLSGLAMQFTRPFSLGDTIKAGSVEGEVLDVGLTTTSLMTAEKFPVMVPNSLFLSQAIVNKSRAQYRAMVTKVSLRIDDWEKIPQISDGIQSMLESNPKIFRGKEAPYCYLSSCAELTIGCNLVKMSKGELYAAEQDIHLQTIRIIKEHGASVK